MGTLLKHLAPFALAFGAISAPAHDGHGMPGAAHWHAADALGLLVVVVAIVALALATRRR